MGIHSSQNLLHLHRDTVLARASLSCLNPMGMGRVQGTGEFQFVCFSNKLRGQELACSCLVILFLSEPTFFFCFLFLFSLSLEASPIQMLLLRSPEGESNGCFWSPGDCLPLVEERPVWGVNDKFTSSAWKGWCGHSVGKHI